MDDKKLSKFLNILHNQSSNDSSSNIESGDDDESNKSEDTYISNDIKHSYLKILHPNQNGGKGESIEKNQFSSNERELVKKLDRARKHQNTKCINKNALNARENRRRKKEYVEKLESDVDQLKSENNKLKKLLKQQGCVIKKYSNEKSYLQSIIANETQISSLLRTLKSGNMEIRSSTLNLTNPLRPESIDSASSNRVSSECSSIDDVENNGSNIINDDPFLTNINHLLFTELDYDLSSCNNFPASSDFDSWDDILNKPMEKYLSDDIDDYGNNMLSKVNFKDVSDHSYHKNDLIQKQNDPGVCLHICNSKVSLEFCDTCHGKFQQAWSN